VHYKLSFSLTGIDKRMLSLKDKSP